MIKKTFPAFLLLGVSVLACQIGSSSTPQTAGVETIVAGTLQAYTESAPKGTVASFENVSFVIPEGLASGVNAETIPEVSGDQNGPWGIAPEYVQFDLKDYSSLGAFNIKEINIYPAAEYAAVNSSAAQNLSQLQSILASPAAEISIENYPNIPFFNAGAMILAQTKIITFNGGTGVRAITQFGQAVGPVTNNGTFYHFQGLTSDGRFYIIAVLPIGATYLAYDENASPSQPADAIPFSYNGSIDPNAYQDYFNAVAKQLNATDPDGFQPSLAILDELMQSLTVRQP
ncbi:MAG: hypothetical protein K8S20_04415 [Chloroflexi bacterium]|nr:hypothetical protein [Chloroflexota bacterium]